MTYVGNFLNILILILQIAIIIRVFTSWFNPNPENPFMILLFNLSEPVLKPLRRILPSFGMIDISPVAAIIILVILRLFLVPALRG